MIALPRPLTEVQGALFKASVAAEKEEAQPEADKIKAERIKVEVDELHKKTGMDREQAEKVVRERHTGKLATDDIVQFQGGDVATVAEILADPGKFHNKPCADPLEPEEGVGRAKLFANADGSVVIHSKLHGGVNYRLRKAGDASDSDQQGRADWPGTRAAGIAVEPLDIGRALDILLHRRRFLLNGYLPSRAVTASNGTGGSGKSFQALLMGISIATGRTIGPYEPPEPARVLMVNVEDPGDDIHRRIYSIGNEYHFTAEERQLLKANLIILPGFGQVGPLMELEGSNPVPTGNATWLREQIETYTPAIVFLDTKSRLFGLDENSNAHAAQWLALLESMTHDHGTAFLIVSHTSKMNAGSVDQHASRGASAFIDNSRSVLNLTMMTAKEAAQAGITDTRRVLSLTHSKSSYAVPNPPAYFTKNPYGVPVQLDLRTLNAGAMSHALDELVNLLSERFPDGVPYRDFAERVTGDEFKELRDMVTGPFGLKARDFKPVIEFGIESARLERVPGPTSPGKTPLQILRVRGVDGDREGASTGSQGVKTTRCQDLSETSLRQLEITENQELKGVKEIPCQVEVFDSQKEHKNNELKVSKKPSLKGRGKALTPCLPPGSALADLFPTDEASNQRAANFGGEI